MTMKPSCNAKVLMATLAIGDLSDEIYYFIKIFTNYKIFSYNLYPNIS